MENDEAFSRKPEKAKLKRNKEYQKRTPNASTGA